MSVLELIIDSKKDVSQWAYDMTVIAGFIKTMNILKTN